MRNKLLKKTLNYVLNGLVIMLPVFGTGYIIYHLLLWLDGIVPAIWYGSDSLEGSKGKFTGWGILVLVVVLFTMGWLGSLFINDRLKGLFEKLLDRIPGVNNLYKTISDILSAFVGNKKKFNQPVLVKLSEQMDIEVVGFVTDTDLNELGNITGKVGVYLPMSYSFAGHLVFVPVKNIKKIEGNPAEILKYTVSGGIVEIEHDDHRQEN